MILKHNAFGLMVAAGLAAAGAAQAQSLPVSGYTPNQDQLLLGFTLGSSTGDLVIDLGKANQVGVGGTAVLDLVANGNVGESAAALLAQLNNLYGGVGGLEWGVIGGNEVNTATNTIFCTVPHGAAAPTLGAAGNLNSAINTAGQGLNDFQGSPANQGIVDPTQGYGESWTEQVVSPTGEWTKNATSPVVTTPSTFATGSQTSLADLYVRTNGLALVYKGYFTLGNNGSLTFTPGSAAYVPPPHPHLSITRSGNTSTISFGTTNGAVYTLHYTNATGLTAYTTNWPAVTATITGNGQTNSFSDTTTDAIRIYRVIAH